MIRPPRFCVNRTARDHVLVWIAIVIHAHLACGIARAEFGGQPRTFLLDLETLEFSKQAWKNGNRFITAEVDALIADADGQLAAGPFSVTFTPEVAPSGDPHDFVSYGPYWWPNPNTPDGLPWIRRDGHGNRENSVDWRQFGSLARATQSLGLAYYFTGDEKYAEKLASLTRIFYLDEATYMNPRMEYSDIIPGVSAGAFSVPGLANYITLRHMFDAVGILEASPHWTAADREGLQQWTRDFTEWAETSSKGRVERNDPANHGTNYDFVFTQFALYNGDLERAESNYSNYVLNRMPGQISEDGSNPQEMKRANNFLYHRYNLGRAIDIGALGKNLDSIDLFTHETDDQQSLRLALDYLAPYFVDDKQWDQYPGDPFSREAAWIYYDLLRRAAFHFKDPELLDLAHRIGDLPVLFIDLTHPEILVYDAYWRGDANLDGRFDSHDLVQVFAEGRYETLETAYWSAGDWNGDRRFDNADLIVAMQEGGYERGLRSVDAVKAVPEPSADCLLRYSVLVLPWLVRRLRGRYDSLLSNGVVSRKPCRCPR